MTAVVDSCPKPRCLFRRSGGTLLDKVGMAFNEFEDEIGTRELNKRLEKAALLAVRDQKPRELTLSPMVKSHRATNRHMF